MLETLNASFFTGRGSCRGVRGTRSLRNQNRNSSVVKSAGFEPRRIVFDSSHGRTDRASRHSIGRPLIRRTDYLINVTGHRGWRWLKMVPRENLILDCYCGKGFCLTMNVSGARG
ncbi:hypothetical protein EVAR_84582_1 [Eumeta japonica]|uniref:Uncharacterized protein n=1 Tax=Eumeta variegata TaxID=151549 RepID=A0A4C1ZFY9_EUMVA|nr:hypothetical protein EVAR_84582_1 [Eumeta japonica]